jgi:hypothetical protein
VLYRPEVNTLWWLMIALISSYRDRPVSNGKPEMQQFAIE